MSSVICYGGISVQANGSIDSPKPNCCGLLNEITSLPYTVPDGKVLTILAYGVEGLNGPTSNFFPWFAFSADADYPPNCTTPAQQAAYRLTHSLMSCASPGGTNEIIGIEFAVPAGKKIHWRIQNNSMLTAALAWYWKAELADV